MFESRLYMDIDDDDDDVDSSSSILIIFFRSIATMLFSAMDFCISSSLLTLVVWFGVGIFDFTNTYCLVSAPGRIYSCE